MALYKALSFSSRSTPLTRGQLSEAVAELERRIDRGGLDVCCYGGLLRRCIELRAVEDGRRVHEHIGPGMDSSDTVLGNLLVRLYGSCRCLEEACVVFSRLEKRNKFSWNTLMTAFAQNGQGDWAVQLFERMPQTDVIGWTLVLNIVAQGSELGFCKRFFDSMPERCDVSWNVLLVASAHEGDCGHSKNVFERMPQWLVKSWNIMIKALGDKGQVHAAINMFLQMPERDIVSWNTLLTLSWSTNLCGGDSDCLSQCLVGYYSNTNMDWSTSLALMNLTWEKMPRRDVVGFNSVIAMYFFTYGDRQSAQKTFDCMPVLLRNTITWNTMLAGYVRCGELAAARQAFEDMPERDAEAWEIMIAANVENNHLFAALKLLCLMDVEGVDPCAVTLTRFLNACADTGCLTGGMLVHSSICHLYRLVSETVLGTSLVNMYGKCGRVDEAEKVFDKLAQRDSVAWTAMISAYVDNGQLVKAEELFREATERNPVTWNVIMSGYIQYGRYSCCVSAFREMHQRGEFRPNQSTYILVLEACAGLSRLSVGALVHRLVDESGFHSDVVVATGLITMYGKCGCLSEAWRVFDTIAAKDRIAWTAMISAYSQNGFPTRALEIFLLFKLQGEEPSTELFNSVLSVCSHAGLLEAGRDIFLSFVGDFGLVPSVDQYVCMVDLLGRSGKVNECQALLNFMPFEPHCVAWTSLMHACGSLGDDRRAQQALEHCNRFDDSDTLYTAACWRYFSV